MAANSYDACMAFVLEYEGGKVDHPKDPGGRTNQGVTQRTYDVYRRRKGLAKGDVYLMADAERDEIYRRDYWAPIGGDGLEEGVDLAAFDLAVNSGVSRAKSYLMKARVAASTSEGIARHICDTRMAFLRSLRTWPTFGKGWSSRVVACESAAVNMARKVRALLPVEEVTIEGGLKPILRLHSTGAAVRALQAELAEEGERVAIDGSFGKHTEDAVKAFQARHGLAPDGIVGPRTWALLTTRETI